MTIVVVVEIGLIGLKKVSIPKSRDHDLVAAVLATRVNTLTGEGLETAFKAADIGIDLANSPSFEDAVAMEFFHNSDRNIFAAEHKAGVRHHVALSVVGKDWLKNSGYFRSKLAQQALIRDYGIPFTNIHSTQFFEYMDEIARSRTRYNKVYLSQMPTKLIIPGDLAAAVVDIAFAAMVNRIIEIAVHGREPLGQIVARFLMTAGDQRRVVTGLTIPTEAARISSTDFNAFLARGELRT